jgi:hypothetical protein
MINNDKASDTPALGFADYAFMKESFAKNIDCLLSVTMVYCKNVGKY